MAEAVRLFARVEGRNEEPRVRHTRGFPESLAEGVPPELLDRPDVLIVDQQSGGGVFLYRYKSDGGYCGDTWHPTVAEAQQQASFEYEGALGGWKKIPQEEADAIQFAIESIGRPSS